jgi:hypothetical protein
VGVQFSENILFVTCNRPSYLICHQPLLRDFSAFHGKLVHVRQGGGLIPKSGSESECECSASIIEIMCCFVSRPIHCVFFSYCQIISMIIQIHCQVSRFTHPLDVHAPKYLPRKELPRNHVATVDDRSNIAVLQVINMTELLENLPKIF